MSTWSNIGLPSKFIDFNDSLKCIYTSGSKSILVTFITRNAHEVHKFVSTNPTDNKERQESKHAHKNQETNESTTEKHKWERA
jgi:hypothetical protein